MSRPLDYALRVRGEKPPHGREDVYVFAEWSPLQHLREDGTPHPFWELTYIRRATLPAPIPYLDGRQVTKFAVHAKVVEPLMGALEEIHACGLWDFLAPYGGGYNFRRIRGAAGLSMHSLGLALDFDPDRNPYRGNPDESRFGSSGEGRGVIRIFELYGWYWGGRFKSNPDAQHFQWCTGV